ncbi:TlpA family protein disulfide reductase [Clostridium beijerinckii]|jgi:peroxiredoxin|uniref:TlpA family protein disulfide reductase n=2 Tax=Clostridium beijerinckii TaxID=1520 RepID=A0AAE2V361_CLOBE|nr:TlpA disulfide reductase family protein [Clostridium beijerinckii]ABR35117.1 alkyl hydroperoxide reductase/ Thiol specific antioxidant/ Mal allergen [Clostridium beijerinckii NCIMB 8052]AIU01756.1 alkyl hydroperoxide reductase/ Thiol specific antioxidant/ Mal allergen [Clostridium beijerinckii ATCC 35702]MBF7810251.1 TlpA family protein disulfide reductase [Clostridium beijerinckii]NRT23494.1 peroxiredoxin [Clostridium beijerinckii]NRT68933.1 peroxiredoxin [Clostridium beijerinckii]
MKKALIAAIVAVALIVFSVYTIYNSESPNSKTDSSISITSDKNNVSNQTIEVTPNNIKTKAIDFNLKDLNGNELSLSDLKGKKVFLNFWATWCPPCKAEMPEIERLYQETKDSDLVIVSVEIGEPLNTVKSFIDSNKYNFKVLIDPDQSVATKYNITSIPTSYFIDKDGIIVSKHVGAMNIDQMKAYIKTLDK